MFAPAWVGAMAWHLWRIASFRPAYDRLSDTPKMMASFAFVFFLAGMTRWTVAEAVDPQRAFFGLVVSVGVAIILFERADRSSSLVAATLGASAVVDFACAALRLAGVETSAPTAAAVEIVLYLRCAQMFSREPLAVRRAGYRRSAHLKEDHPS
jgi:hypothetical protein